MKEKLLQKAQTLREAGVIMHLAVNVLLSIWMIAGYSSSYNNYYRIATDSCLLIYIIPVLLLDSALTVLWLRHNIFHTLHLTLYILLNWLFYMFLMADFEVLRGMSALAAFVLSPVLTLIGLIPFIAFGIGRKNQSQALNMHEENEEQ